MFFLGWKILPLFEIMIHFVEPSGSAGSFRTFYDGIQRETYFEFE